MVAFFGLYVHFPFCLTKCPYCDFNSFVAPDIPHARYADATLREIESRLPDFDGTPATLYFGGGTPGLWAPLEIKRIVDFARSLGLSHDAEITVEANPGALETPSLEAIRDAGANRISFGCQSFNDRHLATLGRRHDAREAHEAPRKARDAGFDNLSLDLIFGIPAQTVDEWRTDLDKAIAFAPEHLSLYSLSLEPEVPMAKEARAGRLTLLEDAFHNEMFNVARRTTRAAGYRHYEISNYAKPGREAVHNSLYWSGAPILAVGAGASGFEVRRHRYSNIKGPEAYMQRAIAGERPESFRESIDEAMRMREAIMTGLRRIDGIDLADFERRFAVRLSERYAEPIRRLVACGLVTIEDGALRLTDSGLFVMNSVLVEFF
ncbi:MAG: radical SAM family heme chaperone HemW [Deltaproteobacteria bacterium]|nr:radical SAM family heme chaperone HemW [Deltaproteobacteria bacterium]